MKTAKIKAVIVSIAALSVLAASAQIFPTTCWRIVNGKGAGVVISGSGFGSFGPAISDQYAEGQIAFGHFKDCECTGHDGHFHGSLFGIPDPDPNGCGWGCVDQMPCDEAADYQAVVQALTTLDNFNPVLAEKLYDILTDAVAARSNNCNSVFTGDANAMGEEVLGASSGKTNAVIYDPFIQAIVDYVVAALNGMALAPASTNTNCMPCKVSLVLRKGSSSETKFFDAKRKVIKDLGSVAVLDAQTCTDAGPIEWLYKFSGAAAGDVPSGSGISFSGGRFCVLSERPATVTVTVKVKCPDGKVVSDSVTVSFQ